MNYCERHKTEYIKQCNECHLEGGSESELMDSSCSAEHSSLAKELDKQCPICLLRDLNRSKSEAARLRKELENIVNAKPQTWYDPKDFTAWAQSRARHALNKKQSLKATRRRKVARLNRGRLTGVV